MLEYIRAWVGINTYVWLPVSGNHEIKQYRSLRKNQLHPKIFNVQAMLTEL